MPYNPTGYDKNDPYGVGKKKGGTTAERRAEQMQRIAAREILRGKGKVDTPPEPKRPQNLDPDIQPTADTVTERYAPTQIGRNAIVRQDVAGYDPKTGSPIRQEIAQQPTMPQPQSPKNYGEFADNIARYGDDGFVAKVLTSDTARSIGGFFKDIADSPYRAPINAGNIGDLLRHRPFITRMSPNPATGANDNPVTGANGNDGYVSPADQEAMSLRNMGNMKVPYVSKYGSETKQPIPNIQLEDIPPPPNVVQDSGNDTAPGSRPIYKQVDGSYSDVQTSGSTPYTPSNPIRSEGVGSNPTGYDNADPYGQRNGQGAGYMGSGGRAGGANDSLRRPQSFDYGPRNPNTGRRQMAINHAGPLNGMGPISGGGLHQMAEQKRAKLQANRLAGASHGGGILRQVNSLNSKAEKAYTNELRRTNNPSAATAASAVYKDQADRLVNFDRNSATRESTQLVSQTQMQIEQMRQQGYSDRAIASALGEATERNNELYDALVEDYSTVLGPDNEPIRDPQFAARMKTLAGDMSGLSPEERGIRLQAFKQYAQLGWNFEQETGDQFTGLNLLGKDMEFDDIDWSDIGNGITFWDKIAEGFDFFTKNNVEYVKLPNGRKIRKDKLQKHVIESASAKAYTYKRRQKK